MRRNLNVLLLAIVVLLAFGGEAQAAGTPNIGLDKSAPNTVLFGNTSTVQLRASNPAGQPTGYNLSFRDVLPNGISYVPGSAPATVGEPQVINNAPLANQTTLIWSNVADLTPNSNFTFTYRVAHSTSVYSVGDDYVNDAGAYINCDPRYVPDFSPNGLPTLSGGQATCSGGTPQEQSYTGSATDSATTSITAILVRKSEPSPEDELLRGLHDHQTVYTIEVENNKVNPTNGLDLEDFIPAGLEFLGCGADDNTSDAPTNPGSAEEYPGSGPINPGNAPAAPGCVAPDIVETVQNPPGKPNGIYTRVVWNDLTDLLAGETFTLRYVAAIPLRENTIDWNGAGPSNGTAPGIGGAQGSNLDNNSGAETSEDGGVERTYTNRVTGSGRYQDGSPGGLPVSDSGAESVVSEDLRVLKSVDSSSLAPGAISTWTIDIATGEYRYVDDIEVTDTLGDGYCPLSTTNLEATPPAAAAECDPQGGNLPSFPYSATQENADGTWTLNWDSSTDPELARIEPSTSRTITFPSRTRAFYQENFTDSTPVLARDSAGNDVSITGDDFVICAPGSPSPCPFGDPDKIDADEPDGTADTDTSQAGQSSAAPSIDKRVSSTVNATPCPTASGSYVDAPAPKARPGQRVCYSLRMDFPANVRTGGVTVNDFIPPGTTYVAGSTLATPNNNVAISSASPPQPDVDGSRLSWPLDDGVGTVQKAQTFEVVFAVTVGRTPSSADGDLLDNLMKAVFSNTSGESFPLRDAAGFELEAPELSLLKGVRDVNDNPPAGNGPNVDGGVVNGGDVVTYRVDVTNSGSVQADATQVWDLLPSQVSCSNVSSISTPGGSTASCNAGQNRIEWSGVTVPANGAVTLTYDVTVPDGLSGGDVLTNTAGVRQYQHSTGPGTSFTDIPASNIDPTQDPLANAPAADDPSNVSIESATVAKTRTTEINQPGNNLASQATIGEKVNYTVTATVPAGTALYGTPSLLDSLGARKTLVAGSASATLDADGPGGAAPVPLPTAGLTLSENVGANSVQIDFPSSYSNAQGSGDDIIALRFDATVDDDFPANQARGTATQQTLPNTATLSWRDSGGAARSASGSVDTTIVEPNVSINKASDATGLLTPGQIIRFTLTGSNASAASTANAVTIVDTIPAGLTPVNSGVPVVDGGTVNPDGGTWDETARTITWNITSIAPGVANDVLRRYDAQVDNDAIGAGTLTNTATIRTDSLADGVNDSGRRTPGSAGLNAANGFNGYRDDASLSGTLINGAITKESSPDEATIGQPVNHTLTISIPPNIGEFDTNVIDDLPDGLIFDDYVSAQCTVGCSGGATDITAAPLTPILNPNGTTRIGWFLGDIAPAAVARTVIVTYTTHVGQSYDGGGAVSDGDSLQNTATLGFNTTNKVNTPPTTPPDPSTFDKTESSSASVDVIEPAIEIDKAVSGDPDADDQRTANPGSSFTYTLKITNTGNAPAYDVTVTDRPDSELTNVQLGSGASFNVDDWTAADPSMRWLIPGPIQPGAANAVTLTYTADLVGSGQLSNGETVDNTADVPTFFGIPLADQDPGVDYNTYTDVSDDSVQVTVLMPSLDVDKTTGAPGFPNDAPAMIETPFDWHIVITNPNVGSVLNGVDALDTLPKNWAYVPNSAQITGTGALTPGGQVEPAITPNNSGDELRWNNLGDLDGAETIVIDFKATPSAAAALDPGVNVAQENSVDASGEDTSGATSSAEGPYADSDDATATLSAPIADLAITKVADDQTPTAGTNTTWTLEVTNNGPETAPDVHVTDILPAGLTYVSAVPDQGSCALAAGTVTCDLGTMASSDVVQITLTTLVSADAAGQTIVNPAVVADPTIDDQDPDNDSDDDSVAPVASADIGVIKELLTPLNVGRQATYELTVTNAGPSVARDVELTDTLPAQLSFVDARGASCGASAQVITCALGDLQPGAVVSIQIDVDVNASGLVTNPADIQTTSPDPNPDNDHAEVTNQAGNADLAINKTGPSNLVVGKERGYMLAVTNVGDIASAGPVTVTDLIPDSLSPVKAYGDGWNCSIAAQLVTCTRTDSLLPNQSFPPITVRVVALEVDGLTFVTNGATVDIQGDPNVDNNTDSVVTPQGNEGEIKDNTTSGKCTDGSISAVPRVVSVGAPTSIVVTVEDEMGNAAAKVPVTISGHGGDTSTQQAKTSGSGRVTFSVRADTSKQRWSVRVRACNLEAKVRAQAQQSCTGMRVSPDSIPADRRRKLRVHLSAPEGTPLVGVDVKAKGAGALDHARTNDRGNAVLSVKTDKAGVLRISAPSAFRCKVPVGSVQSEVDGGQLTG